jgi:hypothetical protein
MKETPIPFNTQMVQAILDGRKTQTRRIIKPQPTEFVQEDFGPVAIIGTYKGLKQGKTCPYGYPGDRLWVKETFAPKVTSDIQTNPVTLYKANYPGSEKEVTEYMKKFGHKWKPSIHMPKAAARIWLQIEEIRAQRLIDITEEDAIAEGIEPVILHDTKSWKRYDGYEIVTSDRVVSFWSLWASINGEESWHSNPWVWVITFKVISTTRKSNLEF